MLACITTATGLPIVHNLQGFCPGRVDRRLRPRLYPVAHLAAHKCQAAGPKQRPGGPVEPQVPGMPHRANKRGAIGCGQCTPPHIKWRLFETLRQNITGTPADERGFSVGARGGLPLPVQSCHLMKVAPTQHAHPLRPCDISQR